MGENVEPLIAALAEFRKLREVVEAVVPALKDFGVFQSETNVLLGQIAGLLEPPEKPPHDFYATYPADGGTQAVAAGDLELDFVSGDVRLPDDSEGKLSGRLEGSRFAFMQSIQLEADQDVKFKLDDRGQYTFPANTLRSLSHVQFQRATLTLSVLTNLKVIASTNPKGGVS